MSEPTADQLEQVAGRYFSEELTTTYRIKVEADNLWLRVNNRGWELRTLHDILNTGSFEHSENYEYIPHVTVARELPSETVTSCLEPARKRWAEFDYAAPLRIESLTLVQQLADGRRHDLAELWLGRPQPARR